jgi:hypothetical protein
MENGIVQIKVLLSRCRYVSYANWSSMFELFTSISKFTFFGKHFHVFYTEKDGYVIH